MDNTIIPIAAGTACCASNLPKGFVPNSAFLSFDCAIKLILLNHEKWNAVMCVTCK